MLIMLGLKRRGLLGPSRGIGGEGCGGEVVVGGWAGPTTSDLPI